MTKVIILGQEPGQEKKLKPIEFVQQIDHELRITRPRYTPKNFKNIELVAIGWNLDSTLDLIFAYDNDRNQGYLYLGHFNDGVVG